MIVFGDFCVLGNFFQAVIIILFEFFNSSTAESVLMFFHIGVLFPRFTALRAARNSTTNAVYPYVVAHSADFHLIASLRSADLEKRPWVF